MFNNSGTLYFSHISLGPQNIAGLKEEMVDNEKAAAALLAENESIKSKIEFMEANKLEEYDEELFKVFEVLKQLDNKKLVGIERAKVIAQIIKSC